MSYPTLAEIIDYLHDTVFVSVPGLAQRNEAGEVINLLQYEPRVIHTSPVLYTLLDKFDRDTSGQVTAMKYRLLHRMVFQWQDNAESESAMLSFVHSVPAAFDLDPTLGGRLEKGVARIAEAASGFVVISNTKYRCLDFFSSIVSKAPYRSGI
jgi:hypothetical protein